MRRNQCLWLVCGILISLTSCSQTEELMAVRTDNYYAKHGWVAKDKDTGADVVHLDDRPRVDPVDDRPKDSFRYFVANSCKNPPASHEDGATGWPFKNYKSNYCAQIVASYAVDQCDWMALNQNKAAVTANLLAGTAFAAGALATDGLALAHSTNSNAAATAALASAVTANSGGVKNFIPANVAVAPDTMIKAAPVLADAVGLLDTDFGSNGQPTDAAIVKLAHVHDQVLSMCGANAIGVRKPTAKVVKFSAR
jgi:hypothetical protein